ncbi:unnamed protein product [Closterium sp. NIES-54]
MSKSQPLDHWDRRTCSVAGLHLPSFSTNLVSTAALQDVMVTTTTPGGQRVSICMCTRSSADGSSLYTLTTEPPQVAASAQVSASGPVAAPCSCRLLSHQTLLWHHRLGHPSLPRLCAASLFLVFPGLCLPSRPCLPHPAFLATRGGSAPLLTPPRFPRRLLPCTLSTWTPSQLRELFRKDLPVLRQHSDRSGEFSSDLLREFCRGKGILQSFTLSASPQQNGVAERQIGLVMEVARTSMIHAAAPRFLWSFAVQYAAHQLNLWPRVSLPETSPTVRWTGKDGDASVFQGPAPSGVSQVDPLPLAEPVEIIVDFGVARGGAARGATSGGAEPEGTEPRGAGGSAAGGTNAGGVGATSLGGAGFTVGARGTRGAGAAGPGGARTRDPGARGTGAGDPGAGGTGAGGARAGGAGAGGTGAGGIGAGGAGAGGTGAGGVGAGGVGARGAGAGGARAGGTGAVGTGAGDPGAGGAGAGGAGAGGYGGGGTVQRRPFFVPPPVSSLPPPDSVLRQVLSLPSSTSLTPRLLCPPPHQSQPQLQPDSPLPTPSPYAEQTDSLTERREPESVRAVHCVPRPRPPPVPGSHIMALCPSSVPLRVPLPSPLASSLTNGPESESHLVCASSPTVTYLLATVVTDPSFESAAASSLVVELVDFAAAFRPDYAASLVAESESDCPPSVGGECALGTDVLEDRQEDFECLAAAVPHLVAMLLAPEGDPDAPNIPTPRSYVEAITGPYSSEWQTAMDGEMASWKSIGTYADALPPSGANIGFDFFQTFSPTPKMTTLWVLLHVAAQCDYELHSLDISRAFLQGCPHEEIWLRRPPDFTGSFHGDTQRSLQRPVYGLRQAPRKWHDTLRTTLAALGFAPSTTDPSLFLRTDISLPPFYVLVYVDDLVFANADTEALTLLKLELQKRHTCTDLGELRSYLGLQITRDRARRTITLTQSHMVHQVLQRFGFRYSSPQSTPLPIGHSLSAEILG